MEIICISIPYTVFLSLYENPCSVWFRRVNDGLLFASARWSFRKKSNFFSRHSRQSGYACSAARFDFIIRDGKGMQLAPRYSTKREFTLWARNNLENSRIPIWIVHSFASTCILPLNIRRWVLYFKATRFISICFPFADIRHCTKNTARLFKDKSSARFIFLPCIINIRARIVL